MIGTAASRTSSCSNGAPSPFGRVNSRPNVCASTERGGYKVLAWLNLFCLDAPLVAISWQFLFARNFGIKITFALTAGLFLTAWLIYLADRFGDNLSLGKLHPTSLRQEFCLRHRRAWLVLIAGVAAVDVIVVATQLDLIAIMVGTLIGGAAALYLLLNRLRPGLWRVLPLKEVSIGFIFAAGTMIGLWRGLTSAALPSWLLFASLCTMNCICIAVWERELDLAQGRNSIATAFPRLALRSFYGLLFLCLTSGALAFLPPRGGGVYACVAGSSLLLAALHRYGSRINPDVRTALADIVLLTPVVALAF